MNKKVLYFVLGAVTGALIARLYFRKKYDTVSYECAKEETDERQESSSEEKSRKDGITEISADDYKAFLNERRKYPYHPDDISKNEEEKEPDDNRPYVITPDEFGSVDEYETISLTYYSDGVLTDDRDDEPIEDVDDMIGEDSLTHFGEYEDDAVYVRNERLKTDFEILLDHRSYSDVAEAKPYRYEE